MGKFEKEIEERSYQRAKEALEMVKVFEKVGDKEKAELLILLDKLGNGGLTRKTNIEIKINEGKISLKDYLEEVLPGVDFRAANRNVEEYIRTVRNE